MTSTKSKYLGGKKNKQKIIIKGVHWDFFLEKEDKTGVWATKSLTALPQMLLCWLELYVHDALLDLCVQNTDSATTEHLHTTVHTNLERDFMNLVSFRSFQWFLFISVSSSVLWVSLPLLEGFVNFRENKYPTASNSSFTIILVMMHKQYCGVVKHLAQSL